MGEAPFLEEAPQGRAESGEKPLWGPWSPDLADPAERKAQLRCLAAIVYMMRIAGGPDPIPLVRALRAAEEFEDTTKHSAAATIAFVHSRHLFDQLPILHQRKIIATFSAVTGPWKDDIKK